MKKALALLTLSIFHAASLWAAPEISLTAAGEEDTVQAVGRPLLLLITVSDRSDANRLMSAAQNRRILDAYKATQEYAGLSDEEKKRVEDDYSDTEPAARTAFGVRGESLVSQLRFEVVTGDQERVDLNVRPLKATASLEGPFSVSAGATLTLYFGVDAADLAAIGQKDLRLVASTEPGTTSNTLTLRLKSDDGKLSDDESRALLRSEGTYQKLDENWDELDRIAGALIERYPRSADGWTFKGDVLLARNDRAGARDAYIKAVELAQEVLPKDDRKGPAEAPMYLIRKITELSD
mgnify:CR=1 FL=1